MRIFCYFCSMLYFLPPAIKSRIVWVQHYPKQNLQKLSGVIYVQNGLEQTPHLISPGNIQYPYIHTQVIYRQQIIKVRWLLRLMTILHDWHEWGFFIMVWIQSTFLMMRYGFCTSPFFSTSQHQPPPFVLLW